MAGHVFNAQSLLCNFFCKQKDIPLFEGLEVYGTTTKINTRNEAAVSLFEKVISVGTMSP